jgi:tetratricopeptide (TPR) repeat protein
MEDLSASDKSVDEVLQTLQKLSNDHPRFLPAQTALTDVQLSVGRCSDAVDSASHAVQAFPTEAEPAAQAVKAFILLGRWADALQMAQTWGDRAVEDTLDADLSIAQMELKLGDPEKCVSTLEPYLNAPYATDVQKWEIALTQAQALVAENKPADAVNLLWPLAQTSLGNQSDWMKFTVNSLPPDQAETWLNRMGEFLKTKPEFARSQIELAKNWDLLAENTSDKRYAKLARDLVHSLSADPQIGATAVWCQGQFDEEDGDSKGAQAAYREAISMAKATPSGHLPEAENNLAMLLATHGGDMKEAVSLAQQLVKANPQPVYYDTLATVLSKNDDYTDAAAAELTAVKDETNIHNLAKWHVNLARLMADQGKRDQALRVIAELDLMTPGPGELPTEYQQELAALRSMLGSTPVLRPRDASTRPS